MEHAMQSEWTIEDKESLPDDDLLVCLMLLTKYYRNSCSASTLTAGLPLENNRLIPSVFDRAARRANLSSNMVKRKLKAISNITLPAVLLLKDKAACILTEIQDDKAVIISPQTGQELITIPLDELQKNFLGYVIYVRPRHEKPKRGEQIIAPVKKHWLWSVFRQSISIYSEVLIASFLINHKIL